MIKNLAPSNNFIVFNNDSLSQVTVTWDLLLLGFSSNERFNAKDCPELNPTSKYPADIRGGVRRNHRVIVVHVAQLMAQI